jgi:replicative DNA helicase
MKNSLEMLQLTIVASYINALNMGEEVEIESDIFIDEGCKHLVEDINQNDHNLARLIVDHAQTPAKTTIINTLTAEQYDQGWTYTRLVYLPRLEEERKKAHIRKGAINCLQALKQNETDEAIYSLQETFDFSMEKAQLPEVGNARVAAVDYLDRLNRLLNNEVPETKIETGIKMFNSKINSSIGGGLHRGQIGAIGARPGRGKSSLAFWLVDMCLHHDPDLKACIFSLEMPAADVAKKLLESQMHREISKYGRMMFDLYPSPMLANAALTNSDEKLQRLVIDDDTPKSAEQLITRANQLSKQGVSLFVVDYIQLVNVGEVPAEMLRVAYGKAVRMLTEDAKKNDRCWIILTQLSRSADGRAPVLSDAKETSAIEENMHWILGLHRDTMNDGTLHPTELQCWILKNRYGPAGERVNFDASWKTNFFTERF